jgi:N-acetylmuramoyl-L-alanine amidase
LHLIIMFKTLMYTRCAIIAVWLLAIPSCTNLTATPSQKNSTPQTPKVVFNPQIEVADRNFIVVIDAGHGGEDSGEIADSTKVKAKLKLSEKALNLKMVQILSRINKDSSIKIILTRDKDSFIALKDRLIKVKNIRPNLFISLHANDAYPDTTIRGIELYTVDANNPNYNASKLFGNTLMNQFYGYKKLPVNGWRSKQERIFVLRNAISPAILLEMGYMSNKDDFNTLLNNKQQINICYKILQAIKTYKKQHPSACRYACKNWAYPFSIDTMRVFKETEMLSKWAVPVINGVEYNNELLTEINPAQVKKIQIRQATEAEIKKYGDIAKDGIIEIETIDANLPFLFKDTKEKIQYWATRINEQQP